jgi:AcrR family transcriptional regulator
MARPTTARHAPTLLQRQLSGRDPHRRPTAIDAFDAARRRFLAGERVDMIGLAEELGVNRVTLYRWVGSREQLLVEVVWSLTEVSLRRAAERARGEGPARLVALLTELLAEAIGSPGVRRWVAEEGEAAMRLLARPEAGFQPRLVAAVEDLLREEAARAGVALPAEPRELAGMVVRLIESWTYLDLVTGEPLDARRAEPLLRLLLR